MIEGLSDDALDRVRRGFGTAGAGRRTAILAGLALLVLAVASGVFLHLAVAPPPLDTPPSGHGAEHLKQARELLGPDPLDGDARRRAVEHLESALRDGRTLALEGEPSDAVGLRARALARLLSGDDARAMADLDEAVRRAPRDAACRHERGLARGSAGDLRGALEDFDSAASLAPSWHATRLSRGLTRERAGDARGAAEDYARALELAPANWPARAEVGHRLAALRARQK